MTKRKASSDIPSQLQLNQYRLRQIAAGLESGQELGIPETVFLIKALRAIGEGQCANNVLGVKAKRGQKKSAEAARNFSNIRLVLSWVASAIAPIKDDGLGMELDEAIYEASTLFSYTEDSIRYFWTHYKEMQTRSMPRPIESYPDRLQQRVTKKAEEPKSD